MNQLQTSLKELLPPHEPPCVSMYIPLQRSQPPAAVNEGIFGRLLQQAHDVVERNYSAEAARQLVQRLQSAIPMDHDGSGPRDAVALFASPDLVKAVELHNPQSLTPTVSVSDSFHIKPLIRMLQADQFYHVLALQGRGVRLYEGDQAGLRRLDLRNLPQTPEDVSAMRLGHHADMMSDLATSRPQTSDEGTAPRPIPVEHFVRAVDKAIWEQFSRDARLPLILVADEKINALFRSISKNPYLMKQTCMLDPQALDIERLHRETWPLIAPRFHEEVQRLADQYRLAESRNLGSSDLQAVANAAACARVDTLLVDASRHIPGQIRVRETDMQAELIPAQGDSHNEDELDDLAEMVLRTGGVVMVLPPEQMPTTTGLAAIYRY